MRNMDVAVDGVVTQLKTPVHTAHLQKDGEHRSYFLDHRRIAGSDHRIVYFIRHILRVVKWLHRTRALQRRQYCCA